MTLIDLLHSQGHHLKKAAATRGGEYAGPCPFCGGTDRFRLWPENNGGRYWCRGCNRSGDAIQFLRDYCGLSFHDACHQLGIEAPIRDARTTTPQAINRTASEFVPKETHDPCFLWQKRAWEIVEQAVKTLWGDRGEQARTFLYGKGLADDAISRARLGWNATSIFDDRQLWGLPAEKKENGAPKRIWVPPGLVIPCFVGDSIARLRVRLADPSASSKYYLILGSTTCPMVWGLDHTEVVVVESELDGILLWQDASDIAGIAALGSASVKPSTQLHELLNKSRTVLVSLDSDEAGAKTSWQFWLRTYEGKAKRWPVPLGKDPSDAYAQGVDLRVWVEQGIGNRPRLNEEIVFKPFPPDWIERFDEDTLERLAIMTVDGGLSDEEALGNLEPSHPRRV